jgi:hypothetical protein
MRTVVTGLVLFVLAVALIGCEGTGARTPRPSPSLTILDFSPQPSGTTGASPSPGAQVGGWPVGWDGAFCAMFMQAVDAQQLLVDVERALDEGANRDARLLADELIVSAGGATDAIAALPEWPDATATVIAVAGLMDLGERAGTEYHAWFANGRQAALRRARDLRLENGSQVPGANAGLDDLADAGLTCQELPLVLEAPG